MKEQTNNSLKATHKYESECIHIGYQNYFYEFKFLNSN